MLYGELETGSSPPRIHRDGLAFCVAATTAAMYDPRMKCRILIAFAVLVGLLPFTGALRLAAQTPVAPPAPQPSAARSWLISIVPPRPTFADDASPAEQSLMEQHFVYWKSLNEKGVCLFGGPVLDKRGAYGVIVVHAATQQEAQALGEADPSVKAGLNRIEVAEIKIAFLPKRIE